MSEWEEQQAVRTKALRAMLEKQGKRANAARKRRKLNAAEKDTATRLKELIKTAKAGGFIANKTLKRWLTPQQFDSISQLWESEKTRRKDFLDKPDEIKQYEDGLREALFTYNRADAYSNKGRHETARKFFNRADVQFEKLLEYAVGITELDPYLRMWFDRPIDWSIDGELSLSPDGMPRVITSRSLSTNHAFVQSQLTIADIKLDVLKRALDELLYEQEQVKIEKSESNKLKQLLDRDEDEYSW